MRRQLPFTGLLLAVFWALSASAAEPGQVPTFSEAERAIIAQHRLQPLHADPTNHVADSEDYEVALDDPTVRIDLPVHMPAKAAVRDMHYDARSRRFSATIVAPDGRPGAARAPACSSSRR